MPSRPEFSADGSFRAAVGALAVCVTTLSSVACRERPPEKRQARPDQVTSSLRGYADLAFAEYSDSASAARELLGAIEEFVQAPSEAGLEKSRRAWILSRVPYAQTEAFRFYGGPIDRVENLVNTWPIDETYIESKGGRLGIVNDEATYPGLTEETLAALNMKEGETSVSTGFHAIEFLLWGQDRDAEGPGNRPHTDYVVGAAPTKVSTQASKEARRRAQYLVSATGLLVRHLDLVAGDWAEGEPDNYRQTFLSLPPQEALGLALKGMGTLSGPELSGERLTVAYETKDHENEHSCFSDNTRVDLEQDAIGIQNLCVGKYRRTSGGDLERPGLCSLVASVDPSLGSVLTAAVAKSVAATAAIPAPFDRAILGADASPGRVAIKRAITALDAQTNALTKAAAALGASIPLASVGPRR
jgi:putative iron-regulated protein